MLRAILKYVKVAPGSGAQVFYDNHPPEVTAINHPEDTSHPEDASEAQTPSRKPRKASFIISFAVALALIAVALGIGIGLGLERHGKNDLKGTIKPSSTTVTSSQPRCTSFCIALEQN